MHSESLDDVLDGLAEEMTIYLLNDRDTDEVWETENGLRAIIRAHLSEILPTLHTDKAGGERNFDIRRDMRRKVKNGFLEDVRQRVTLKK